MADKKISQLTALAASSVAPSTDVLAIVDSSATETKKITAKDVVDGALNAGTANGVLYLNGSKEATSGSGLTYNGSTLATTGALTVDGNATLGNASTDTVTVNGYMGVGGAGSAGIGIYTRNTALTGASQIGVQSTITASNAATSTYGFLSAYSTAASAFTVTNAFGYRANNLTLGAGSSVTNLYGLYIADQTSGTNNYGIASLVSSGSNKWNIYASGTANNYFAGNVGIGTSPSGPLDVVSSSGAVGQYIRGRSSDNTGSLYFTSNSSVATEYGYVQGRSTDLRIQGFNNGLILQPSSGNVGIGTSSPSYKLDVSKGSSGTAARFTASSDNGRGLSFTSSDNGIFLGAIWTRDVASGSGIHAWSINSSEKMRLDSSGNLGIGTSSPGTKLQVNGGVQFGGVGTDGYVQFLRSSDGGAVSSMAFISASTEVKLNNALSGPMTFYTNNTERMRLDSSGNLGLGVTPSASTIPQFEGGSNLLLTGRGNAYLSNNATFNGGWKYIATAVAAQYNISGAEHRWFNAPSGTAGTAISFSQAMTLDASGNLLVGKSVTTFNTAGFLYEAGAAVEVTRSGNRVMRLNRTTNDGSILEFNKDGTTVGTIGVATGPVAYMVFNNTATDNVAALKGASGAILPSTITGADKDGTMNLGSSGARFENLYLSGGAYLGGTAAANLLDDYEEGTWTPTYSPQSSAFTSITYDAAVYGKYVKVGAVVHIQGIIRTDAISGGSGAVYIGGMPFTADNYGVMSIGYTNSFAGDNPGGLYTATSSTDIIIRYRTAANSALDNLLDVTDLNTGGNSNYIIFSGTYMTTQ